jgi:hypothetical protein
LLCAIAMDPGRSRVNATSKSLRICSFSFVIWVKKAG